MVGLPEVKNIEDYNRLDRIPTCDRQTDRQTNRQTDGQTDILPCHSPRFAYASRGKNDVCIQLSLSLHFYLLYLFLSFK